MNGSATRLCSSLQVTSTGEQTKVPAVVVGADACGLGIVRSLAKGGVHVTIVDSDPRRPAMHSRYARAYVARGMAGSALVESLSALRSLFDERPVLFLTTDDQYMAVSEHRDRVTKAFRFQLPNADCVADLLHKPSFQRLAEQFLLPVPRAVSISNEYQLHRLAGLQYPAVIKPATAVLRKRVPRALPVSSCAEAEAVCRAALPLAPDLIVQEWVEGEDAAIYFCLQYRAMDNSAVYTFTGRKIRCWPPHTGNTASCTGAPEVADILEALTNSFFAKMGFVGLCSMEFKHDRRSGAFVMIEPTAGRADWQEEIATLYGINIPLAAYHHEIGLSPPKFELSEEPLIWRDPAHYWRSVAVMRSLRDTAPAAAKIKSSCWRHDDPLPLAYAWFEWLRKAWQLPPRDANPAACHGPG